MTTDSMEIDDGLYSRQRYVLGEAAMKRITTSSVLISGMTGLGAEVAKNVALAGVRVVTLHDTPGDRPFSQQDLSTHFYAKAGAGRLQTTAAEIAKLNPYVKIGTDSRDLGTAAGAELIKAHKAVVLVDCPVAVQRAVDAVCRTAGICFVSCSVRGVFGAAFSDCGGQFTVSDADGEEPKEVLVQAVSNSNPAVVACFANQRHELSDGDSVTFREVGGMPALNSGAAFRIKTETPFSFSLVGVDSTAMPLHTGGGTAVQAKTPVTMSFLPLSEAISAPRFVEADLSKCDSPAQIHAAFLALDEYSTRHSGRLPGPWNVQEAAEFATIAASLLPKGTPPNDALLRTFAMTCYGAFQPMAAFLGGVVGQEVIKCLTGKYTPLNQFLYSDMREVVPPLDSPPQTCAPRGHYLDGQAACIGWPAIERLAAAKLFVVGAGAIGCELLKNFALIGVATSTGRLLVTDPDLIATSNLNRQFLFRADDVRKPKASTAARAVRAMNPAVRIEAANDKVGPQTEDVFTDDFFESLDVAVNALDNVAARLYMDSRCVSAQRPLLESGTLGTKGHVQVIVPHLTENYGSQRDPPEKDIPFCTVHSFPNHIDHAIQWSKDAFAKLFTNKPAEALKAISEPDYIEKARAAGLSQYKTVHSVTKLLAHRPRTYEDCVAFGMARFRAYFDALIAQLLVAFPLDTLNSEGKSFWAPPRRPPKPISFNTADSMHLAFVRSAAAVWASVHGIEVPTSAVNDVSLSKTCAGIKLPPYRAKTGKKIATEEKDAKAADEQPVDLELTTEKYEAALADLAKQIAACRASKATIHSIEFEKDDDTNGHVDFVWSAANVRATNYSIQQGERLQVKRIAGRIIPAIATTTAAVSGLVTCELVKVLTRAPASAYRNTFLNLALSMFSFSEPAPPAKEKLAEGVFFTVWDSWIFKQPAGTEVTLQQFMQHFKQKFELEVTAVLQGQRMIYADMIPTHAARLGQTMVSLLNRGDQQKFVELVVTFADSAGNDVNTPAIRFVF